MHKNNLTIWIPFFIFDEKASHSNPGKTRQGMTRHGKATPGEARRGKTRRRQDKKVSHGFEKYCMSLFPCWSTICHVSFEIYTKRDNKICMVRVDVFRSAICDSFVSHTDCIQWHFGCYTENEIFNNKPLTRTTGAWQTYRLCLQVKFNMFINLFVWMCVLCWQNFSSNC